MTNAFNLSQLANNTNSSGQISLTTGVTGTISSSNISPVTGTGNVVLSTNAVLTTPNLGTPSDLVGTNISGASDTFVAGFGVNQTWQVVTRALATTYTNSTGKPIYVKVTSVTQSNVSSTYTLLINGTVSIIIGQTSTQSTAQINTGAPIPVGATYRITASGSTSIALSQWTELR